MIIHLSLPIFGRDFWRREKMIPMKSGDFSLSYFVPRSSLQRGVPDPSSAEALLRRMGGMSYRKILSRLAPAPCLLTRQTLQRSYQYLHFPLEVVSISSRVKEELKSKTFAISHSILIICPCYHSTIYLYPYEKRRSSMNFHTLSKNDESMHFSEKMEVGSLRLPSRFSIIHAIHLQEIYDCTQKI